MKKIILAVLIFLSLAVPVFAEDVGLERIVDIPTVLFSPPTASTFALGDDTPVSTPEELLYSYLEEELLRNCPNNVMLRTAYISLLDFEIPLVLAGSATDEEIAYAEVINPDDGRITQAEIFEIYINVVYNHPEIGNLITGAYISKHYDADGNLYCGDLQPYFRPVFKESAYNALATEAERELYLNSHHDYEKYAQSVLYAFSKAIAPDMTKLDKIISLHNYFTENCSYEPLHAESTTACNTYCPQTNYLSHSPYSALVGEQVTVCQGYALAFKLLCDMAGIECGYAVTDNHIWNIVELDGNYYHFDLTWDDGVIPTYTVNLNGESVSIPCSSEHSVIRHFVFMTDAEISKTHTGWTTNMPECNDDTLRESIFGGDFIQIPYPMYWKNGNFYFEGATHKYDSVSGTVYHVYDKYCIIIDGTIWEINAEQYLPNKKLEAEFLVPCMVNNSYGFVAIDGTPNTTAELYAAEYDEDGRFVGVEKLDVTFDRYGEAVAEFPINTNKLMLFENGTIKPIAYYK